MNGTSVNEHNFQIFKLCHYKFIWGNKKAYIFFFFFWGGGSFFNTEMAQVVETLPRERQEHVIPTWGIPWLLISWSQGISSYGIDIFPVKYSYVFSCDQAALWMVFSVRLSVCPSVCPSVRLSHLFDYVPIIVSSWNFQELSHWTRVRSMQKVKVRGQRSRSQRSRPKFSFPDCNSSLNSHMMIKLYI